MYGLLALSISPASFASLLVLCGLLCSFQVDAAPVQVPAPTSPVAGSLVVGDGLSNQSAFTWLYQSGVLAKETRSTDTVKYGSSSTGAPSGQAEYVKQTRSYVAGRAAAKALVGIVKTLPAISTALALKDLFTELGGGVDTPSSGVNKPYVNANTTGYQCNLAAYSTGWYDTCQTAVVARFGAGSTIYAATGGACAYPNNNCRMDVPGWGNGLAVYPNFQAYNYVQKTYLSDQQIEDAIANTSKLPEIVQQVDPDGNFVPWESPKLQQPPVINLGSYPSQNPDGSTTNMPRSLTPRVSLDGKSIEWTDSAGGSTGSASSGASESRDLCADHPNVLACQELDTPDGEIPKSTKNITYEAEQIFGGGSCPADKFARFGGQQIKVWDWQQACGYIVLARPVLIAAASFMAMMIVIGAKVEL